MALVFHHQIPSNWFPSPSVARIVETALVTPRGKHYFVSPRLRDPSPDQKQTLEIEGIPRGHVFASPDSPWCDTENPRPFLESSGKLPSDELLWTKIHQYLAEKGPILCWIWVRSESYPSKNSKMSGTLERLSLRICWDVLYQKVVFSHHFYDQIKKIDELLI